MAGPSLAPGPLPQKGVLNVSGRTRLSSSLATSIHLVCRPRPVERVRWAIGPMFCGELPTRVADWMQRLAGGGRSGRGPGVRLRGASAGDIQPLLVPWRQPRAGQVELPEYLEKGVGGGGPRGVGAGAGHGGGTGAQRRGRGIGGGLSPDRALPLDDAEHIGRRFPRQ